MTRITSFITRGVLAAALVLPVVALSEPRWEDGRVNDRAFGEPSHNDEHKNRVEGSGGTTRHGIPEFDPAAIGTVAAILAAGGILLARRRRQS